VAGSRGYSGYGYGGYRYGGSRYGGYGYGGFYRPYYAFRPRLSLGFGLWAGYPVAYPYYYGYPYAYPDPYSYAYPSYSYPAPSYGYPPQAPPSGYPPQDPSSNGYGYPSQAPSGYPPAGYPSQAPSGYPPAGYQSQAPSGYPPAGTIGVQPGAESSGGVSFQIEPTTAAVYVDGNAVGTVGSFGPTSQPLALAPGRHHIEVRAPGYRTMAFETDVVAGQVIPYQGTLQRQ
jgi:hypothetical protein